MQIGIGIGLGTRLVGLVPATDVNVPAALIQSRSNIVVVGAEALNPADLVSMVTSKTFYFAYHTDAGVIESGGAGTGVSQLTDMSAAAKHATSTGTAKPTLTTSGGPGGGAHRCLTLNGTAHGLTIAQAITPAVGAPFFRRTLARVTTGFTSGGQLTCGSATNRLGTRVTTGPVTQSGNTSSSSPAISVTVGVWYLWDEFYNNTTADFLRVGTTAASTGVALGNVAATSLGLGARADLAAAWLKCEIVASMAWNGQPTTAELNAQAAWFQKWHGAANIVVPTYP